MWAGRYAVFDELASGGMASVFLACRLGPGESARVVAIKKLFESFAKQPGFVTMFLDEAHIAARIRHPNVVTTFEFLRIPDSLGIVMEFVLGASLLDLLEIAADRKSLLRSASPPPSCRIPSGGSTPRTRRRTSTATRSASCTATCRRTTSSSARTASRASSTSASPRRRGACR